MHSGKLKAMLHFAAEAKLRPLGGKAGVSPLEKVLKDFNFAKQRFDSTVDPAAKLALQLLPVTIVLAIVASDPRNTKERRGYAERCFSFLKSKFVTALGISADWGIVWEVLLRLFDHDDHDIAASWDQLGAHIGLLRLLFLEGGLFDTRTWGMPMAATRSLPLPPVVSHSMGEAGVTGSFITEHVGKQVAQQCEFNVAGRPVVLWGPLAAVEKTELGERLQNATALGIGRLEADLLGTSHLRSNLRCFHTPLIQKVFGPSVVGGDPHETQKLKRCFRELWQMLKLPFAYLDAATDEYAKLANMFARATLPGGKLYGRTNRKVWSLCLDADYMAKVEEGHPAPFQHVFPVVRLYMAILDGTIMVERDHALIRAYLEETHGHADIALLEDFLMVRCSKTRPDDMVPVDGIGRQELGHFGLRCARKWREILGARLGIGRHIAKGDPAFNKGKRCLAEKAKHYKHIKKGVLKATGHVASHSSTLLCSMVARPRLGLLGGQHRHANGSLQPGTPQNKFWNPRSTA